VLLASGLKNAFVVVHSNRFGQILGVFTLQASSEPLKVSNRAFGLLTSCSSTCHSFTDWCTVIINGKCSSLVGWINGSGLEDIRLKIQRDDATACIDSVAESAAVGPRQVS